MGKTALSVQLARHYSTAVVSADARQFYHDMMIGTARPTPGEMQGVRHEFVGHLSIHDAYNAGLYEKDVLRVLPELFSQSHIVFLTGGSGLYINAVCQGVDEFDDIPPTIRQEISEKFASHGLGYLREELQRLDPAYFAKVDTNNPQRMMRALEVSKHTGRPYSSFRTGTKKTRDFEIIPLLIDMDREMLYDRINRRVDAMMAAGLEEEARALYPYRQLNALHTVGYKELFSYFDGTIGREQAVEEIKRNTRHYAKRQLTWFNNQGDYEKFGPSDFEKIRAFIDTVTAY